MTTQVSKRMVRWTLVVVVVSPLAVAWLNFYYTNSVDERAKHRTEQSQKRTQMEADYRWCELFQSYVDPAQPPPTTDRGREQLKRFVKLYKSLGCETR